ncbi:HlyD family secretion protein [Desulfosarcina ovata]|uniref:Glycoside hydrolase family 43 n=2 Tax=Desulfosarcina ovata TaxID=83564 RepID=A0A5K8AJQ5_9BACT|nr:HlyD family efflux transporter periplasmic adaptor subunit [Desulfosarcina ovata]BBO82491.1 glycoside hydrolase family 43 [Desulfosarcina ovata subsp. sediminis]BBO92030.1 glycoside hydrolase family 43 [Desulfosarcina ovata subsp. ovata]
MKRRWIKWAMLGVVLIAGFGAYVWLGQREDKLPEGIASGNGRIEATEVDVATKLAGRLTEIMVREGDMVAKGQTLARMDTRELAARRRSAQAEMQRAEEERRYAAAMLEQQRSQLALVVKDLDRYRRLYASKSIALQSLQRQETARDTARAAVAAARARQANATAAIDAVKARIDEIQSFIDDSTLMAPVDGRVLYRLAEPGEVLGAGGRVLTLLDVSDVTMTIFLPTNQAGRVDLGSDARIILDARPDWVIPARVSFVAPKAQFTPKDVETRTEREKLMFRIKVRIDPELLKAHAEKVKTGLPGMAYLRLGADVLWPPVLKTTLDGA